MTRKLLTHYAASVTAKQIVHVFAGCLREEELHDAYTEVYAVVKASLERFQIQENRLEQRMRPGVN
jgi:hypothetical protein